MRRRQVLDVERAAGAVPGVGAALVVLGPLEVGQHLGPGPAGVARGRPVVVVARLAAHVDHGVDRARAAEHLAARLVAAAAVQPRLRHGLEGPVGGAVLRQHGEPGRAVDQHALVDRAGLEQADRDRGVFAQPAGEHAARRAAADDDVVELPLPRCPCRSSPHRLSRSVLEHLVVADDLAALVELALALDPAALVVDPLAAQPPFGVEALLRAGGQLPAAAGRGLPGCPRTTCGRCRGSRFRGAAPGRRRRCTRCAPWAGRSGTSSRRRSARRRARSAASGARAPSCRSRGIPGRGPSPGAAARRESSSTAARGAWCRRRRTNRSTPPLALTSLSSRTAPLSQSVSLLRRSPRS